MNGPKIDPFKLSSTLKQGAPPEVTSSHQAPEPPTNDTCCGGIFKELHSSQLRVPVSRVTLLTHSCSLVLTSCTVSTAINTSTVVNQVVMRQT